MSSRGERCPVCGLELDRLGGTIQREGARPPVEIVHFVCTSCGRRFVRRSETGELKATDRDLSS